MAGQDTVERDCQTSIGHQRARAHGMMDGWMDGQQWRNKDIFKTDMRSRHENGYASLESVRIYFCPMATSSAVGTWMHKQFTATYS
jgi:hypothetical protein